MSKYISLSVLFTSLLFFDQSKANPYEEAANSHRWEFILRACSSSADLYSSHALWTANYLKDMIATTKPNSKERDRKMRELELQFREFDDQDFLVKKDFIDQLKNSSQSRKELLNQLMSVSRMIARNAAYKDNTKSKIGYQREIEIECKYALER